MTDREALAGHRHRYGLIPVWTKDGSAIESWWWCTDHPKGEWAKIEDEPDAPSLAPSLDEGLDIDRFMRAQVAAGLRGSEWGIAMVQKVAAAYRRLAQEGETQP